MYRPIDEIAIDRNTVDITDVREKFKRAFDPDQPHDAFRFLNHLLYGVTKETVSPELVEGWLHSTRSHDQEKFR